MSADPLGQQPVPIETGTPVTPDRSNEPPPIRTVGPLTDSDVIKLRPCEKKQVNLANSRMISKTPCVFDSSVLLLC